MISWLVEWTERTFLPYGTQGLFWVSFADSSFFPVPPDIILLLLVLVSPESWFFYSVITIIGSVLGAMFGYWLGWKFGLPLLRKVVKEKTIKKVHNYFEKYEVWAVGIGAFTPLPYKVFTIGGGIFYIDFKKFVIVSAVGRTAKYIPEAFLMAVYGRRILDFIEVHFTIITLACLALIGLWFYYENNK